MLALMRAILLFIGSNKCMLTFMFGVTCVTAVEACIFFMDGSFPVIFSLVSDMPKFSTCVCSIKRAIFSSLSRKGPTFSIPKSNV